ncbi:MAG: peroxide stress protein YaaA [Candidatus Marinimicrobia bacterium]|nr:peroxide stress protein YaaA [Candidatus Neomarinimicrobiota bacterium]MCF7850633.1 peroxide stress protein YaaA [Candidatus Neomarinimicrobiota bacterium]MCF7903633.1 peroxide stress protein YaaA [Candidatus Neomarinimicrobiota bacterium]
MIGILSPAKSVNFDDPAPTERFTLPEFLDESEALVKKLRSYSKKRLMSLMSVSEKIAALNHERFEQFSPPFTLENAKQAMYSFTGDVYRHMRINTYDPETIEFAQDNLRILSGLYGYLRPLDLIQPYRLEMKTGLKTRRGKDLYKFWGSRITEALKRDLDSDPNPVLINLASQEYSRVIDFKALDQPVITILFKEVDNGRAKTIAIFAKWARGMMMDHIIQNKLSDPEDLKTFNESNYQFSKADSDQTEWVFTRPRPE